MILTPLHRLPNNMGKLGKIILVTGFEWLPKVQKSPNLVTLLSSTVEWWLPLNGWPKKERNGDAF